MARREVQQSEIAEILGLTTRQIRNLDDEGMPHRAEGNRKLYPVPEAVAWYYQRQGAPTSENDAKLRKLTAEAETAELNVARMRGELLTVEEAIAERSRVYGHLRAKLLNMPSKYAPTTVGCRTIVESQTRWEAAVNEAMAVLADTDDEFDGDEGP